MKAWQYGLGNPLESLEKSESINAICDGDIGIEADDLDPSEGAWQKPYDVLIREAIGKTQQGCNGSKRMEIFRYIRCKYQNMKYKSTLKGVGNALRRMIASGHIVQVCPGRYARTKKPIYWKNGVKFDRTICGQEKERKRRQARKNRCAPPECYIPWKTPCKRNYRRCVPRCPPKRRSCAPRRKPCRPKQRRCPPRCPPRRRCPPRCPPKRRRCPPKCPPKRRYRRC